jgi:hypothetical protein
MIIYSGYIPWKIFPLFRRQKGMILNRLVGINLFQGTVEPVYHPIVEFTHQGNFTWIVISNITPLLGITLMKGKPFIHIERIK